MVLVPNNSYLYEYCTFLDARHKNQRLTRGTELHAISVFSSTGRLPGRGGRRSSSKLFFGTRNYSVER